jgi:hypothetical protein
MCNVILKEEEMLALVKAITDKDQQDCVFYREEVLEQNCNCAQCHYLRITCSCNAPIHLKSWHYNTQIKK